MCLEGTLSKCGQERAQQQLDREVENPKTTNGTKPRSVFFLRFFIIATRFFIFIFIFSIIFSKF